MRRTVLVAVLASVANAPLAVAQEVTGPQAGTWGAETVLLGGASLLRFRSPSSAWLLGGSVSYRRVEREGDASFPLRSMDEATRLSLRLGHRWYRNAGQRLRPFTTVSSMLTVDNVSEGRLGGGAALEFGAMHFFSRHVSLGASGELRAEYHRNKDTSGSTTITSRHVFATLSAVRLLAAVYF